MRSKKSEFMGWVDERLAGDASLAKMVDEALAEMRLEQQLAARRERLGLTQTQLAERMGMSQPAVARLESGRVRNLELRTIFRWAVALGARPVFPPFEFSKVYSKNGHHKPKMAAAKR